MSRIPQVVVNPDSPMSIVDHLYRVGRVVDGRLEFGSPQDPEDPASVTLANGTTHNGTLLNLAGSWFEKDQDTLDTRFDCAHNLGIPVTVVGGVNKPNVRWLFANFQHNGTGVVAGTPTLSVNYDSRDAASITTNSFPLRLYAAAVRTVNAGNPVRVTLFFTGAVR